MSPSRDSPLFLILDDDPGVRVSRKSVQDHRSIRNALEIDYVDLADVVASPGMCIRFTFFWPEGNRWEGQDYEVTVR